MIYIATNIYIYIHTQDAYGINYQPPRPFLVSRRNEWQISSMEDSHAFPGGAVGTCGNAGNLRVKQIGKSHYFRRVNQPFPGHFRWKPMRNP